MASYESNVDRLLKARAEIDEELRRHKSPVTILFTDVVGSTSYFDRYGDTAGFAMLQRVAELSSTAVGEFQGTVIKTIGDSVMAEFPDAVLAVRAAAEIQRRLPRYNEALPDRERIQLRIGIHHGTAFRHGNDVYGDAVNLAARITKRTGPAQILVSWPVREAIAAHPDLPCNRLGKIAIEGRTEKEDIYEIVWTDPASYRDLRQNVTAALARGELVSPGVSLEDLVEPEPAAPAATTMPFPVTPVPLPQGLLDRYEILGEAGAGGIGVVYKARDRETGEFVALKVLKPEIAADEQMLERFKNELRLARKITHKNVCRIYDFLRINGTSCISMEFVEGESLRQVLNRFGNLSARKVLQIASQICAGLREAHAQGIVHRDLKPENVVLDRAGNVKLMDFGIARQADTRSTQLGAVVGTPAYMAPEQAEAKPIDHRTDIYALGLLLYELFTGAQAFSGDTPVAVALKQIRETPPRPRELEPTLPAHLEEAILKCIEKAPAGRFQSVDELEAALRESSAARGGGAPRRRAVLAGAVLAVSMLVAFWLGWRMRPAAGAPPLSPTSGAAAQQPNGEAALGPTEGASSSVPAASPSGGLTTGTGNGDSKNSDPTKKQNGQARYSFNLSKSDEFTRVGPVSIRLNRADPKRQTYTLTVRTRQNRFEMQDRALSEPVRFYYDRSDRTMEIVVNKIEEDRVTGYLLAPRSVKVLKPAPNAPPLKSSGGAAPGRSDRGAS